MLLYNGSKPYKTQDAKNEDYHLRMARFFAHDGVNDSRHSRWLEKIEKAKSFYRGDQWVSEEDLSIFFQDKSGNPTQRVKLTFNVIRPIVETYRGSTLNMGFNGSVYSVGTESYKRKLLASQRVKFLDKVARGYGGKFMEAIATKIPLGDSPEQTEANFEDLYVDDYAETMNNFLQVLMKMNDADKFAVKFAESCALTGAIVARPFIQGGHWSFRWVPSHSFFFDRSCIMDDTSDAEYWGEVHPMNISTLIEENQGLTNEQKKMLESAANLTADAMSTHGSPFGYQRTSSVYTKGRVPVYKVVWADVVSYKYGYIENEDGNLSLERIDYIPDGEKKPRFKSSDVVPFDKLSPGQKRILRGSSIATVDCEQLRFCNFVPSEYTSGGSYGNKMKSPDVVLSYGVFDMEERDPIDPRRVKPPYKVNFWSYMDGIVTGPIDDIIDPQRFINRILSVTENKINTAPHDFIAYDKRAASSSAGSEAELLAAMASGGSVGIDSRGLGLPNVIAPVTSTSAQNSIGLLNIVGSLSGFIQHTTGVNGAMQGGPAQRDQLVGVTESLIERGSLLQLPFFNAVSQVYLGLYNSAVTEGKRIYAESKVALADIVGESGANIIMITKEIAFERWACSIRMDAAEHLIKQSANNLLTTLLQLQIIDRAMFAELFNKSTPESIASFLRSSTRAEKVAAREQEKVAGAQAEAVMEQEQQMAQRNEAAVKDQRAHERKMQAEKTDGDIKKKIMSEAVKQSFK